MYDVVILTDRKHAYPNDIDGYVKNVIVEDALLQNALGKIGLKTLRLSWDDEHFDWSSTRSVLFRTTWDYFDRFDEFSSWLNTVSKQTRLINSEAIIRWNIDKHYLKDLSNNGVHIAETYFIEKGSLKSLKQIHEELNWAETVLKPCVSGGGWHTYRLNSETIPQHEAIFEKLIAQQSMILQPFQHNIVSKGEVSFMVFNGQFTHAVLKKAKQGDFRVQDDFGGTVHNYIASEEEVKFAENTVNACKEMPLYARVDAFIDNSGKLALAELELIEPELWFRNHPKAAEILAEGIKEAL
ncbi:hypothetical protein RM697_02405 [Ichthyenterobacterium sp. W332]|uniref:Prokaryotic glutathione synthetase ATP-binding domain-containing protein n=1 Tax=Microcosmobacter mediterraneus TaxID=3075607 RepID=A0ABU2YH38_9FLAO|nr:hypothetical protein [Ichthyenterobacterium sp. W332]MDT0557482.1 hypothetical protein [Ichthyenterobacterium sp. W332]